MVMVMVIAMVGVDRGFLLLLLMMMMNTNIIAWKNTINGISMTHMSHNYDAIFRCGPEFPLDDGLPSECDGSSFFPCCSKWKLFLSSTFLPMRYTVDGDVCQSICLFTGGVIVVPGLSTALATLVWITGGTIPVTRVSMRQPQWVEQDKTPTHSWPCNIFVHKTRQDITGGTGHNKKLTLTRQYKSGHDTFYKD